MPLRIKDKLKPDKDGLFPLVDAEDIEYKDARLPDFLFQPITQEDYNKLRDAGKLSATTPYLIVEKVDVE